MNPGTIQVKVQFDPGQVARRFHALPPKMQRSIRRKAMRRALGIIRNALRARVRLHRTGYVRPHLGDETAIITRNYRKSRSRGTYLLWGGVGIRFGEAPLRKLGKIQGAAVPGTGRTHIGAYTRRVRQVFGRTIPTQTVTVRTHGRKARGRRTPYQSFLPGWRWHFIDQGTRRFVGRQYMATITQASRNMVVQKFRQAADHLVRTAR